MKKLLQGLGTLFMVGAVIFLLLYSMVVTGTKGESFARDLFGFPIPHPPVWTSYIPILGSVLGFIFEFFSIHGLIGIAIAGVLFYIGGYLMGIGEKKG